MTTKTLPREVVEARKKAREETGAVRAYLEGLKAQRGRENNRFSPEDRLKRVDSKLEIATDVVETVVLKQKRRDILAHINARVDVEKLEIEFIKVAKPFSDRKGISYPVWKEMDVPASVLRRSGIRPS